MWSKSLGTNVHFIDVGQGNMVLIEASDGKTFFFDCNITNDNEDEVLDYVEGKIGYGTQIHAFICSHRDADHMRGVKRLHAQFPIRKIWDSGYPGTTTDSTEYREYMELRRQVGSRTIEKLKYDDFGRSRFRFMSAKDERLPDNANAQGIVLKVEHRNADQSEFLTSAMLTGDSDAQIWRNGIMKDYEAREVDSTVLMAGHHGSITFFDDPADTKNYYTAHIKAMSPVLTMVSVCDNPHGHPDAKALEIYEKHTKGTKNHDKKIYRTDKDGTKVLEMHDNGSSNFD